MRLNARVGSATQADVDGSFIGGKTETSNKVVNGRNADHVVLTAFMDIAPANAPRCLIMTMIDEPKGLPATYGLRTSGWNAVPATRETIRRVLPILEVTPERADPVDPFPAMTAAGAWGVNLFDPVELTAGVTP